MYLIKVKIKDSTIHGKGYFADQFVPMGTIVYCYSSKDIKISKDRFEKLPKDKKNHLVEFAVEDEFGNWVETETGPFTNHSCDPTIMPIYVQGNYLDIAIKDINIGDEITLDYGLFYSSEKWEMNCTCGSIHCRGKIGFGIELDCELEKRLFDLIKVAVSKLNDVEQPIYNSADKQVMEVACLIKKLKNVGVGKHMKFSLINT